MNTHFELYLTSLKKNLFVAQERKRNPDVNGGEEGEEEEAQRLADAIRVARSGRQPNLPGPSGVPLDIVVDALRSRPLTIGVTLTDSSARQANLSQSPMPQPAERIVADPGYDLPEWLRPHG